MPFIPEIPLSDIKVIRVTEAPVGSISQISDNRNTPTVVLRSQMEVVNGSTLGVISLEGSEAGLFSTDLELLYYAALDVTKLVSLALGDPAPPPPQRGHRGAFYEATTLNDEPFAAIAVALRSSPDAIIGYVQLDGPRRGHIDKTKELPRHLGKAVVVPLERD
jgi:hypothetical protein